MEIGFGEPIEWAFGTDADRFFLRLRYTDSEDSDGDGLSDWWEWYHFGHLFLGPNTDYLGDGVTLQQAYDLDLDPTVSETDADGLPDSWKIRHFATYDQNLEKWAWTTSLRGPDDDPDNDGLTNAEEFAIGTDPMNDDTDGDGMTDGWEVTHGLDPLDNGTLNFMLGPNGDISLDGLTNLEKFRMGMDPNEVYQHQSPGMNPPGGSYSASTLAITVTNPNPVSNTAWNHPDRLGFVTYTTDGRDPTSADPRIDPSDPVISLSGAGVHVVKTRTFSVGSGMGQVAMARYFLGGMPASNPSTVYYGVKSAPFVSPTLSDITLSYSSSGFDSNKYTNLGPGWIVNGSFKPDPTAASAPVYYGRLEYTPSLAINAYSRTESGFGASQKLAIGNGWITGPGSMKPDFNSSPGEVYYGYKPNMGTQTFFYTRREADIAWPDRVRIGTGWANGIGGFQPSAAGGVWVGSKTFSNGQRQVPVYSTHNTDLANPWSVGAGKIKHRAGFKADVRAAPRTIYSGTNQFFGTAYAYNPGDLVGPTEVGSGWIQNIGVIQDNAFFWSDADDDGLINGLELHWYESASNNRDTSGDFLSDSEKAALWDLNGNGNPEHPFHPNNFLDPYGDTDGDGLTNYQEFIYGTNPLSGNDRGALIDRFRSSDGLTETTLLLTLGDHSGSRSEIYRMVIEEIDPVSGSRSSFFTMVSPGFGIVAEKVAVPGFKLSHSYAFRIEHVGSTLNPPDLDYTMMINVSPEISFVIDDPDHLLGAHGDDVGPNGEFLAEAKEAKLAFIKATLASDKAASGTFFSEDNRIVPITLQNPTDFRNLPSNVSDPCEPDSDTIPLVIFYESVSASGVVEDFEVQLSSNIPEGWGVQETWTKATGPDSGTLLAGNPTNVRFVNPEIGGLYQFDLQGGSSPIRTSLLLPLAGADITDWLQAEIAAIELWAQQVRREAEDIHYSKVPFRTRGKMLLVWTSISGSYFDYVLDPVDAQGLSPCRRFQSPIRPMGHYGYVTVNGVVVHGSKINIMLWSLFGREWGWSPLALMAGSDLNNIDAKLELDPESSRWAVALGAVLYEKSQLDLRADGVADAFRLLQDGPDLIEEKLWPSPYPADPDASVLRRPDNLHFAY